MKLLLEESSSIAKAIEKGWERAGKPQSFSVKVFELPEKNFLGMTTKYAKIGIFFAEKPTTPHPKKENKQLAKQKKQESEQQPHIQEQKPAKPKQRPHPRAHHENIVQKTADEKSVQDTTHKEEVTNVWHDEQIKCATEWLQQSLHLMSFSHVSFSVTPDQHNLKINFNAPILENQQKQPQFFRSLSYLIMASLRTQCKTDLKGLRVLLTCE